MTPSMEQIVSLCKRRGFIFQGSEIYGGLAGTFDYGPLGVALKNNIKNLWWKQFVENRTDMYGVDAAILMNQKVWQASGHVGGFSDPLVECSNCKSRFREDQIDISKCPSCSKEGTFGQARQFNMMFKTNIGVIENEDSISYLRPETAQGMFVNFKNILDTFHPKLPFGMAQIGKAFRNEIAPRDFIFRVREFEQMEIEYFVDPRNEKLVDETFDALFDEQMSFINKLGLSKDKIHKIEVPEGDRAHYSKRSVDTEYDFPFGQKELLGLAYRTDYDLSAHIKASGADLTYFDEEAKERFVPHCIEPTFGLDRLVLAVLSDAYKTDGEGDDARVYLSFPVSIAPIKVCVSPLVKNKEALVSKARELFVDLKKSLGAVVWDDNGNVGKRYRRQDEIGTPFCVVVDFDTLGENPELLDTVTVRDRDTGKQERIAIKDLEKYIEEKIK
ncbi:MAG: glycine--tRNA ligase [Candidatus Pacebacteria bacterium]|nr:glycine--tRNA ligase [Candidatus Paceibacterota bacterium]